MRALMLALACGGCIPAVPFVVGETAETLKPREVSAALYGGGGGVLTGTGSTRDCCGGVMARVRVGVGHAQEVGVEGGAYLSGGGAWGTAKLDWKLQVAEHYALVAGLGTTFIDGVVGLGGDAGVIASTSPWRDRVRLYAALRATMMLQTNAKISDGGGVLAGGVAYEPTHRLRVALEIGAVGGGGHQVATGLVDGNAGWFGGYGAALVSYAWRR
ncbi:MAG TPA: hypothetical protein VF334_06290 [Polyangia bacterium]